MADFSTRILARLLADMRPATADGALCVAFSGGVDSVVLLAALAELRAAGAVPPVRAIHVNHGLHPDAGHWQRHCQELAAALEVPFVAEAVDVTGVARSGVEAAARTARYAALHRGLAPGEILLTAHHADDQLETVLLALMRGSGVRGLAGMPKSIAVGRNWHQRPLLDFTRGELAAWGHERGLAWIEDPSNAQSRYSRNFLRQSVVPVLRDRWPAVAAVVSRSAAHLAEASDLLDELAQGDLGAAAAGDCISVAALAELSSARRRNLLRYWIRRRGLPLPGTARLCSLERDVLVARPDRHVRVRWTGAEVRRYRGLLYAFAPLPDLESPDTLEWDWSEPLVLPGDAGELRASLVRGRGIVASRLPPLLEVQRGVTSGNDQSRRSLRKLLQARRVLPWWRDRMPVIRAGGDLVAVGDLWIARGFAAAVDEPGVMIDWRGRPAVVSA